MPSSSVVNSTMKKGTKRKIEIKKRETKQQRAVTYSKRRQTLFSKAADLCRRGGANIAVFVTSPSESSDVVYSFSGHSSANEIADCYLNNKPPPKIVNPQSKLGLWWKDPDLCHSCDDLSELNFIEDRIQRMKKHVMACLEKEEKSQLVSNSNQNPSNCSLDEDCGGSSSQFGSNFGPNPSSSVHECCSDQTLASFHGDQNPISWTQSSSRVVSFDDQINGESSSQACCFDPKPSSSTQSSLRVVSFDDQINGESSSQVCSFDPNPISGIQGCSSSSEQSCLYGIGGFGYEIDEENNQNNLVLQEIQRQDKVNLDDESCFWNDIDNNLFGLDTTDDMFDLELEDPNEEEVEWLDLSQFFD